MITPNLLCHENGIRRILYVFIFLFLIADFTSFGQNYPPDVGVSSVNWGSYQIPQNVPNYLQPFTDPVTNITVTRISDETVFGCNCSKLRHRYAKNQPWNADGTLIMTDGSPSKILDGNTYEVLYEAYPRALWSNTEPNYTYDTGNSTLLKTNVVTGVTTTVRTFSGYTSLSIGNNEGNLSIDDRYVAMTGASGSNKTIIVYDIQNDVIVSTRSIGTANIDWVSVSQSGNYVVVSGYADGSGSWQGIKAFDKYMNNEIHLYNGRPHGDIGYDAQGNEVYVAYQGISGYSLSYARLDNGVKQGLFPYSGATGDRGLWGGHISTRNINRPGWAYVSDQGHPSDINRHEATREIFAIKLDNSQTIERFAKHHSNLDANSAYNHQAHGVPNRDGTRVLFASNWDDANLKNNSYPLMWVAEVQQNNNGVTANAGPDVAICNGNTTTLTATGGSTYLWNTGATTASITVSPTATTTYTVTAYDASGANSDTDDVIVTVNPLPVANAGADVSTCLGTAVTLSASGGSSYLWSNGATTQTINVNPNTTTTYSVQVTQNGCTSSDTVIVTVNPAPTINAGTDVTINLGESTTLTATGGSSYSWNTGATTSSITVSPTVTTTYTVIGTLNGCQSTDTVTVFLVDSSVTANAGPDVAICNGNTTTLTATGGSTYLWNTGATTASITVSPTATTTYTVTAYDASGANSDTDDVIVTVNPLPVANAGADVSTCLGTAVTLSASGGSSYLWSNGATTQTINVNPNTTTTYSVQVTQNGCTSSDTVIVTVNPAPTINAGTDVTINLGESTTLTATGGSSYSWNTGATTSSITVSPTVTTTYTVIGTLNGCQSTDTVTVFLVDSSVTANAGPDVAICNGNTTTLTATGGSTYLWNTGATTASITVSPTATTTYTVTAYDASGANSDTDDVIVTVNPTPTINAGTDVTINLGESTTLTATGGSSYSWNTGATTSSVTVSPTVTTTYTVIGTLNGCQSTDTVTVFLVDSSVTANAGPDVAICNGNTTTLTATGGSTYVWNTGATTASITVSPTATTTYTVTAYDASGANSDIDEVIVTVNPTPTINAGTDATINLGESTTLTATGGSSYAWSNGATTSSITVSPIVTTTYTVTGTLNGCQSTDVVIVTVVDETIIVEANAGEDVHICRGDSATLTASGGDTYLWSTGETTQSIEVTPNHTTHYTVTAFIGNVQDDATVTVYVSNNPNVVILNGNEVTMLQGEFITLSASGANTYLWNNGATQPNIAVSPNATTTYSVKGFVNNCSDQKEVVVNVLQPVSANAGSDVTVCLQENTVTLTASGGDEYLWNTGETTPSITVNPEVDTEYSVTVYNALDYDIDEVMVYVNDCEDNVVETPEENFEFLVYPNPTHGELNIRISGLLNVSSIYMYDLSGKTLYSEVISENGEQQSFTKTMNISNFAAGIYLLKLIDNRTVITKKIILR